MTPSSADAPQPTAERPLTGRHVLIIALCAFAVILAANLTMAFSAVSSFPGLVDKNSWVASQNFTRRAEAQAALGWTAAFEHRDGVLSLSMTDAEGAPVRGLRVIATVGRPSDAETDQALALAPTLDGYAVGLDLAPGVWRIATIAHGPDAAEHRTTARLVVKSQR